ncbi:hypothetical protein F4779DRAFT_567318 [Xylariaceae sp. FL0662B]|nr:hypothetical protein F4779DRAFT_567318 [Xylariaceae sp. FL0662B]
MENKNDADNNDTPEDTAAYFRENPVAPVRILISTATHLVPGDDFIARTDFIANLVSQYHWNHDFEWGRDRFDTYNADFGYDNRRCIGLSMVGKDTVRELRNI